MRKVLIYSEVCFALALEELSCPGAAGFQRELYWSLFR